MPLENTPNLSVDDVIRIAHLAHLSLDQESQELYTTQINAILSFVSQLNSLDLSDQPALVQVSNLENIVRSDQVIDCPIDKSELFSNATNFDGNYLRVKRIIR
ncbi:Asp-tRNA(Asn)/Glu-tRNA(Gln) amidotransferase subunit GatC [Candidatus Saccharibacteria bacterium]|nr:Asp-tRNA(Asn)/Glu-tRNA(Gln) amidotransferase subunit GatC [Candidatus Saccharibacteria bacterium]MCB9834934.1 Asp-tRNA(Asn)/Glu-tRNA(Gln) amidotransferase subunit GatC [Candidatus Nomurabacteria bacterium]